MRVYGQTSQGRYWIYRFMEASGCLLSDSAGQLRGARAGIGYCFLRRALQSADNADSRLPAGSLASASQRPST
jgi:hypothetical protein